MEWQEIVRLDDPIEFMLTLGADGMPLFAWQDYVNLGVLTWDGTELTELIRVPTPYLPEETWSFVRASRDGDPLVVGSTILYMQSEVREDWHGGRHNLALMYRYCGFTIDDSGQAFSVCTESGPSGYRQVVFRWDREDTLGSGWTELGAPGEGSVPYQEIAVDPTDGRPIVAFGTGGELHLWKWESGTTWSDLGGIGSTNTYPVSFKPDPVGGGVVMMYLTQGSPFQVTRWSATAGWEDLGIPETGTVGWFGQGTIAVDPIDGHVVTLLSSSAEPRVYSTSGGGSWAPLGSPSTSLQNNLFPVLTVDALSHQPIVAFADSASGNQIRVARFSGGTTWTDLGLACEFEAVKVGLSVDTSGAAVVACMSNISVQFARYSPGGGWSSFATALDVGGSAELGKPLTFDFAEGLPVVATSSETGPQAYWFGTGLSRDWRDIGYPPGCAVAGAGNAPDQSIAFDSEGRVFVVCLEGLVMRWSPENGWEDTGLTWPSGDGPMDSRWIVAVGGDDLPIVVRVQTSAADNPPPPVASVWKQSSSGVWSELPGLGFVPRAGGDSGIRLAVDSNGSPILAYTVEDDSLVQRGRATVARWNGSGWDNLGPVSKDTGIGGGGVTPIEYAAVRDVTVGPDGTIIVFYTWSDDFWRYTGEASVLRPGGSWCPLSRVDFASNLPLELWGVVSADGKAMAVSAAGEYPRFQLLDLTAP